MKLPAVRARLPVRSRATLTGAATATRTAMVYCPVERTSVGLDRCSECERCEGVRIVDEARHVLCRCPEPPVPSPRKVVPSAADLTPVAALIAPEVTCLSPSLPVAEATVVMLARNLTGAPVVDDDGRPVGILTRSDLLRARAAALVADAMMPVAFGLAENDSLARAAALMATEGVQHLLVIGDFGRVVGIVSTLDVTRWLARQAGFDV
jgi:CBS domain-containing protein